MFRLLCKGEAGRGRPGFVAVAADALLSFGLMRD